MCYEDRDRFNRFVLDQEDPLGCWSEITNPDFILLWTGKLHRGPLVVYKSEGTYTSNTYRMGRRTTLLKPCDHSSDFSRKFGSHYSCIPDDSQTTQSEYEKTVCLCLSALRRLVSWYFWLNQVHLKQVSIEPYSAGLTHHWLWSHLME